MNVSTAGLGRSLSSASNWQKWWPADSPLNFNGKSYKIIASNMNLFDIQVNSGNDTMKSRLALLFLSNDSSLVTWQAETEKSTSPFTRFFRYKEAKEIERDMTEILTSLRDFAEKTENIYGFDVKRAIVTDSVLVSTRSSFDHKPGVHEVDNMIQRLKIYIAQHGAVEKNLPMLNVRKIDSSHYEVMTAIPVDRELPATKEFAPKFLFKGGNILEAEIKGGPATIETAFDQLENYRVDYKFTTPAIPFQSLVTDRVKEPDTTKWITRLYYPVF